MKGGPPSHPPPCLCLTPAAVGGQKDACLLLGVTQHLDYTVMIAHTHTSDDLGRQRGSSKELAFWTPRFDFQAGTYSFLSCNTLGLKLRSMLEANVFTEALRDSESALEIILPTS